MARTKLSKGDEYYIENHPQTSVEDIAKDLNISVERIQEHREYLKKSKSSRLLAKRSGSVAMTSAVSERADDLSKKRKNNYKSDCIHIINENK